MYIFSTKHTHTRWMVLYMRA